MYYSDSIFLMLLCWFSLYSFKLFFIYIIYFYTLFSFAFSNFNGTVITILSLPQSRSYIKPFLWYLIKDKIPILYLQFLFFISIHFSYASDLFELTMKTGKFYWIVWIENEISKMANFLVFYFVFICVNVGKL